MPLQDPKFTEPIWHVPALEHCPTFAGIVLLPFVAQANNPPRANIGFIWLPTAPDDVYGYVERLWLVTIRPIPRGAFLRANITEAWAFYSWDHHAAALARQYELAFVPGAPRPALGGPTRGYVADCPYYNFSEVVCGADGVPRRQGYSHVPWDTDLASLDSSDSGRGIGWNKPGTL